jgi:hypothetical protein
VNTQVFADARSVRVQFEEAGAILLSLPVSELMNHLAEPHFTLIRPSIEFSFPMTPVVRPPVPPPEKIKRMQQVMSWIHLIEKDRVVVRSVVAARALIDPITDESLFSWRLIARLLGCDQRAVERWYKEGIEQILKNATL